MDVGSAALALAAAGLPVFPVQGLTASDQAGFKAPQPGFRWSEKSTTDPQVIISWFSGRPDLGVAVDCAKARLLVVDIDHERQVHVGLLVLLLCRSLAATIAPLPQELDILHVDVVGEPSLPRTSACQPHKLACPWSSTGFKSPFGTVLTPDVR